MENENEVVEFIRQNAPISFNDLVEHLEDSEFELFIFEDLMLIGCYVSQGFIDVLAEFFETKAVVWEDKPPYCVFGSLYPFLRILLPARYEKDLELLRETYTVECLVAYNCGLLEVTKVQESVFPEVSLTEKGLRLLKQVGSPKQLKHCIEHERLYLVKAIMEELPIGELCSYLAHDSSEVRVIAQSIMDERRS